MDPGMPVTESVDGMINYGCAKVGNLTRHGLLGWKVYSRSSVKVIVASKPISGDVAAC
jgi:hypothetical protein